MNYKRITIIMENANQGQVDYVLRHAEAALDFFKLGYGIRVDELSDDDLHPWKIIKRHLRDIWIEVRSLLTEQDRILLILAIIVWLFAVFVWIWAVLK